MRLRWCANKTKLLLLFPSSHCSFKSPKVELNLGYRWCTCLCPKFSDCVTRSGLHLPSLVDAGKLSALRYLLLFLPSFLLFFSPYRCASMRKKRTGRGSSPSGGCRWPEIFTTLLIPRGQTHQPSPRRAWTPVTPTGRVAPNFWLFFALQRTDTFSWCGVSVANMLLKPRSVQSLLVAPKHINCWSIPQSYPVRVSIQQLLAS